MNEYQWGYILSQKTKKKSFIGKEKYGFRGVFVTTETIIIGHGW